ncbi:MULTISPECIES: tetratricopeptide repeat protein [Raoultella]|uniref:tetratricopeptide repeat protein n=1 Tax=Raoultella TaxID=160674 RepID=UPI002168F0EE|nr:MULTISPECIES: tetratricopeptide repeat protein [Raoultella]MCS4271534.1 Ca-activated chloride channel family protein [Raoultella sp. BIGb0132]MCS4288157.1 Ca-activated chloride channel family protein [Raoultella terrigena]
MSEFHFIHPWWLVALIPCALLWFVASGQRSAWHQIMDKPFARALIVGRKKRITRVLPWLCALGVLALAGPTWQRELPAALTQQSNLMVVLQQDPAMYAQDLAPSRHQRMQSKIMQLMEKSAGNHFGLVVYNANAWLTTPLTNDPSFYSLFLHAQSPNLLPEGEGSGLKRAIALAMKNMPEVPNAPRNILLIADNVSAQDAKWLAQLNAPLQVWVPGTARGGELPEIYAQRGIDTRLNVERFSSIRDSGIPVTLVTSDDSDVAVITSHIQQSVASQNNARGDLHWKNSGYLLTLPMLILLLFGRRQLICWLVVLMPLLYAPQIHAAWQDTWISPDMQGQIAFSSGDYVKAAQRFQDPLWQGIAFYRADDFVAAASAFRQAPQTAETQLWLGNSYAQQKQWQQALNSYDRALSLSPDWEMAHKNRAAVAKIIMALRQKERDRQAAQGKEQDYKPDEIKHDLKKGQGVNQQDIQPKASSSPQINQWFENLEVSPSGLLENLYRANTQEEP